MTSGLDEKYRRLELLSFDVDGVLTDGKLLYTDDGREIKAFNVQDGASLKLLRQHGIEIAILTGRRSAMVERRADELGITHVRQGLERKGPALKSLADELRIPLDRMGHVGDDLPDLELFELVGLSISVPNGHPVVQDRADLVTTARGGEGVARELAQLILGARGEWPY